MRRKINSFIPLEDENVLLELNVIAQKTYNLISFT